MAGVLRFMFWLAIVLGFSGCRDPGSGPHPHGPASAEPILLHASGACLARIARLEEHDDRPCDGDHRIEAWLEIKESSGSVPEFLRLVIDHGGMMPIEVLEELEASEANMVLRHDSLKQGEWHWFVFSEDYDSSKYPYQVAGWWRHGDGNVPADVVDAVQNDRFADHPVWDKTLNVVSSYTQSENEFRVRVREGDSLREEALLFDKRIEGTLQSLHLAHFPTTYEMEWPDGRNQHLVHVFTVGDLPEENEFGLPPGAYRINYAYELETSAKAAVWVARNQEIWLMQAFRQYDLETGKPAIVMEFELLPAGGNDAGGETEQWYRRTVKKFHNGKPASEEIFRHGTITHGTERVYSSSGWIPVSKQTSPDHGD